MQDQGFGLHTMLVSNELNADYMVQTAAMLLEVAAQVSKALDIRMGFINIGGGLGIPYAPGQSPLDIVAMAAEIADLFAALNFAPQVLQPNQSNRSNAA